MTVTNCFTEKDDQNQIFFLLYSVKFT